MEPGRSGSGSVVHGFSVELHLLLVEEILHNLGSYAVSLRGGSLPQETPHDTQISCGSKASSSMSWRWKDPHKTRVNAMRIPRS